MINEYTILHGTLSCTPQMYASRTYFLRTVVIGLQAKRFFQKIPWSLTKIVAEKKGFGLQPRSWKSKPKQGHIRLRTEDPAWKKTKHGLVYVGNWL